MFLSTLQQYLKEQLQYTNQPRLEGNSVPYVVLTVM